MAFVIDSSVLITLERRGQGLESLRLVPSVPFAVSAITASELIAGALRSGSPQHRVQREAFVEGILATVPLLPFDLLAARVHAEIWTHLATIGQMIGNHDLLIAATALAHGYGVLTLNLREFQRVPGLVVRHPFA